VTLSLKLSPAPEAEPAFEGMVGSHPAMALLYDEIRYAAPFHTPLLIEGATGTGKELVARAVHAVSGRKGALVIVRVAELAEPLAEAELFGASRGAFTGAVVDRKGLIVAADQGTLVLDEAGDLPVALQVKLLRVLETNRVRAVGGDRERAVSFRLVVNVQNASRQLVDEGRWRQDFYYRVAGITIRLPTLGERMSDVPLLANHFLAELGRAPVAETEVECFRNHQWPGNVRELRRAVERAIHHARGKAVTQEDFEAALYHEIPRTPALARSSGVTRTLREIQHDHIRETLARVHGNGRAAAAALGLSKSAFYRRIQELGIAPPERNMRV